MKTANQILLQKFNEAFANNDTSFILENVTDNIRWNVIGGETVKGKMEFKKALESMRQESPLKLKIHKIITHGRSAAVNGEMGTEDGKTFAFCDIYQFNGFRNPKISELTSYSIEV